MRTLILIILSMAFTLAFPYGLADTRSPQKICADREVAEEFLRPLPLRPLEGLWEYPADEVTVMVIRDADAKGRYNILLVEAVDCRLVPGMCLGWIEESADKSRFRISLSSKIHKGVPAGHMQGLATLNADADALIIEMPKVKVSLSPSLVLPSLWNYLRLSVRMSTKNPLDRLPQGWIKVFPSYDGNGSSSRYIRYL
ncbi:MAG: hypothetical protein K2O78_01155 [Muribaculaceae bacterium]|nr:hypothetical protein [Muribaculaceae bacterium]